MDIRYFCFDCYNGNSSFKFCFVFDFGGIWLIEFKGN